MILIGFVTAGVFTSIYFNLLVLALLSIGLGMVVMSFFKAQISEVIEDERVGGVQGKAASMSFRILLPILGLTSFALLYAGEGPFFFLRSLGVVIGYVTTIGIVIYLVSYWYFNRASGG
jgi:uncharacterized membrane protein